MNKFNKHTDVTSPNRTVKRAGALVSAAAAALVVLMSAGTAAGQEVPTSTNPPTTAPAGDPGVNGMAPDAPSKPSMIVEGTDADGGIHLSPGKTRVIITKRKIATINIGNPDAAFVKSTGPNSLMVTAKKPGGTGLILWDEQGQMTVIDVTVEPDMATLRRELKEAFPNSNIIVTPLADSISLRGTVPSLKVAEQVVELATAFGKVHNFLEVSGCQQVMLQVRFAEVSKSATQDLGINFGGVDGISSFGNNVGQISPLGFIQGANNTLNLGVPTPSSGVTLFGSGAIGRTSFAYFLQALEENGLVRMLAEPNVMATSGKSAEFTAGGEFPVPVSQGGGTGSGAAVTVDYKEYGVKLNFTPIVLGDGTIRLEINPEVSELDFANAVRSNGFLIPALTTRKVHTTVELSDGQSLALAGLLNQNMSDTTDAVPLLGDIPVLGVLFRSTKYQRSETELVVLVTPRLVAPMNPDGVPLLPGEHWRHPNEAAMFFLKDMGGPMNDPAGKADKPAGAPPQFHGNYGFSAAGAGTVQPGSH
jgi:pilus assembly protein CpaC